MLEHILAPLDGSSLAECALPHVVALARAFDAQITLLHVVEQPTFDQGTGAMSPLVWRTCRAEAEAYTDRVATKLSRLGLDVEAAVIEGRPAKAIIDFAHKHDMDLIALSSHGQSGLSEWGISSVAQKVTLGAYTSIYIVRAHSAKANDLGGLAYRQLLVPLDGSQRASCATGTATVLARAFRAELLMAHVVHRPEVPLWPSMTAREQALLERLVEINLAKAEQYMAEVKSHNPEGIETTVCVGDSSAAELHRIVDERQIDLMVLSAHGYSGEPRWPYGSVCLNLLLYGSSPLLIFQDIPIEEHEPSMAELAAKERQGH
jgi:nucleotide-binding universal stress UspA family protein